MVVTLHELQGVDIFESCNSFVGNFSAIETKEFRLVRIHEWRVPCDRRYHMTASSGKGGDERGASGPLIGDELYFEAGSDITIVVGRIGVRDVISCEEGEGMFLFILGTLHLAAGGGGCRAAPLEEAVRSSGDIPTSSRYQHNVINITGMKLVKHIPEK